MGMYTELIFGAELKKDTPEEVIKDLKAMVDCDLGNISEAAKEFQRVFCGTSYYFGVSEPVKKMWWDRISKAWHLSTRSNIKNYGSEIERFLAWIEPHISSGSGIRNFYAIVTYEENSVPKIYYLHEQEEDWDAPFSEGGWELRRKVQEEGG